MKCLLDTHSFIWAITDSNKLSEKVTKILEDPGNEISVSVITFWEMSIKQSIGKLDLGHLKPEDFIGLAADAQISIVNLSPQTSASSYQLPWRKNHRDPFDRMLVWKALHSNFSLVSRDSNLHLYLDLGLKLIW